MLSKLAQFTDIRLALVVGGLSLQSQASALRSNPEIVVATPVRSTPSCSRLLVVLSSSRWGTTMPVGLTSAYHRLHRCALACLGAQAGIALVALWAQSFCSASTCVRPAWRATVLSVLGRECHSERRLGKAGSPSSFSYYAALCTLVTVIYGRSRALGFQRQPAHMYGRGSSRHCRLPRCRLETRVRTTLRVRRTHLLGRSAAQGRLIDHLRNTQAVGLEDLQALVLDEADRLLEMGFAEEARACQLH